MPDEPVSDVISGGRDRDRRGGRPGRLIAGVTAAVLIVSAAAIHLILAGSHHPPRPRARAAPSAVALTAPSMLHGTPLPPGGALSTRLFLGGDQLRLLTVGGRAPASLTTVLLGAAAAGDPLGSDPAVQQITSAAGGIVALIFSHGSAGLPDIGDVIFVPVSASGTGAPRIIARANYMALAPNRRDIWVEQAAPPWGNGPAGSPAWLVDEDGHRLTGPRDLGSRALVAATVGGLFVRGPDQKLALIDASNGAAEPTGVPGNAIIAGADADDVAWQAATCAAGCPLHITDLRGRPGTQIALPPGTVIDPNDTSDFDPARPAFRSSARHHRSPVGGGRCLRLRRGHQRPYAAASPGRADTGGQPARSRWRIPGRFQQRRRRALGCGWLGPVDRRYRRAILPGRLLDRPRPTSGPPAAGRPGLQIRRPGDRPSRSCQQPTITPPG